jgi:16S rRNA processing protein RimM
MQEQLTEIGYTKKTHGAQGELKVVVEAPFLADFLETEVIFLPVNGKPLPFFVEYIRAANDLLLKLEGVDSPSDAKDLTSKTLLMRSANLSNETDEGEEDDSEFTDFQGFMLYDKDLGLIGEIKEVVEFPQQEMAIVDYGGRELLIPLHDDLVDSMDEAAKKLTLVLPEGLLNL